MRYPQTVLALIALTLCLNAIYAGPLSEDVLRPSVAVSDHDKALLGSGTVIKVKGETLILTAAHVVSDQFRVRRIPYLRGDGTVLHVEDKKPLPLHITERDGKRIITRKAEIAWCDNSADLALLKPCCEKGLTPAVFTPCDCLEPGEDAWYCGSGSGLKFNLVKTIVNQDDGEDLIVNGEGWKGHSGSGLFVKRGKQHQLLGVVVALRGSSPRAPIVCVRRDAIYKHLNDYLQHGKGKTK